MYGKKILSRKTKGQKARGQHGNVQCITEGLIAGTAVMVSECIVLHLRSVIYDLISKAHFLMTHNPEFTATGMETKINYHMNYDFYLECLFKCTPWARSIIDYFNKEVLMSPVPVSHQLLILLPLPLRPELGKTISWTNSMLPLKLLPHSHPSQLLQQLSTSSPTTTLPYLSIKVNLHQQLHSCSLVSVG
jgi:hypothetical protein